MRLFKKPNEYLPVPTFNSITIMLSTESKPICGYSIDRKAMDTLSKAQLDTILTKYAPEYKLSIIYPQNGIVSELASSLQNFSYDKVTINENSCTISTLNSKEYIVVPLSISVFCSSVENIFPFLQNNERVNIMLYDYSEFNEFGYESALRMLKNEVLKHWRNNHKVKVNLITDPLGLTRNKECSFGKTTIFLAPDGNFYLCPAFYYSNHKEENIIGNIETGWAVPAHHLTFREYSPICRKCKSRSCLRCIYENKNNTLEYNIPSYEQCKRFNIETKICTEFFNEL